MKRWLIALPLLFAFSIAKADGTPQQGTQPEAAKTPAKASPAKRKARHPKRLPKGDLRYCLDLKDNAAIIRCAETGRKK